MTESNPAQLRYTYVELEPGDPAPWFKQRTPSIEEFFFSTAGGHYVVLCFFASPQSAAGQAALKIVRARRNNFDDTHVQFYGVVVDPRNEAGQYLNNIVPGIRFFYDTDQHVCKLYGALPREASDIPFNKSFRARWVVLDRMLRVVINLPISDDGHDASKVLFALDRIPPLAKTPEVNLTPPILILPNVFEPDLCRHMISLYEADGGYDSGYMNQEKGKTVGVIDYSHKRRRDYQIEDQELIHYIQNKIRRRLLPEIEKAFQFKATHIERHLVACYSADDGGHFNAHRDNSTLGTVHRRFAVTFNLNDAYEGGDLSFPEFGTHTFRASVGGAIVFSCSLMHAAGLVTKGRRYAYLPFLYDEAAAVIRAKNRESIIPMDDSLPRAGTDKIRIPLSERKNPKIS